MALQPVRRQSVPEDVFDQIVAEVLSGDMQPGEALPSERRLAEILGVSRPAIREAMKRLTEAGLVDVRQGESTTVRDFRRHAGLDLLPRLLIRAGEVDVTVVRSILETRLHNGPKIAELAARRRPEVAALLDASVDAQMVVLGRFAGVHHLVGFSGFSTCRRVLHHARCPVSVVPVPAGASAGTPGDLAFDETDQPEF